MNAQDRLRTALWSLLLVTLALASPVTAHAQHDRCLATDSLPPAVRSFVPPGACAIALERADLDRDGRVDYLLVVEHHEPAPAEPEVNGFARSLRVLTVAGGTDRVARLRVAAESQRAVWCSRCGGMMGDPFEEVEVRPGRFTVYHYGGTGWRWRADFTFAYSRRDRAWQLVKVVELSHHVSDPKTTKRAVFTPPKDFGKIDLRDFDPEDWKGRGVR